MRFRPAALLAALLLGLAAFATLAAPAAADAPETFVARIASDGLDRAADLAVAPDGDLILVGTVHDALPLPPDVPVHWLGGSDEQSGAHRGIVLRLSPDDGTLRWIALFPAETFSPSRVAVDAHVIAIAGDPLSRMSTFFPPAASDYGRAAVLTLAPDGTTVRGARGGPPNTPRGIRTSDGVHSGYSHGITGISLHEGLIYVTGGTSGTGQGAYIVRYDADDLALSPPFPGRPAGREWAIDLRYNTDDLWDALFHRYDRDDPRAEFHQGECSVNLQGNRRGGQVLVNGFQGGTIFASFDLQYRFNCTGQTFPAFDAVIGAWDLDGNLRWVTNALDQLVSEPDQGPRAMAWDSAAQRLVVALWQHGSNVARLPGQLTGDTGNISIGWVGTFDPADGRVMDAWYQHAPREDSNGNWGENGQVERWPRNSGNTIHALAVDATSRVFVVSRGGNRMFTTPDALMDWPEGLWGGHAWLGALTPDLAAFDWATTLRAPAADAPGGSDPMGLALTDHGLFVFGHTGQADFVTIAPENAPWHTDAQGRSSLFLARITADQLPFGLEPAPDQGSGEAAPPRDPDAPASSDPGPGDGSTGEAPESAAPGSSAAGDTGTGRDAAGGDGGPNATTPGAPEGSRPDAAADAGDPADPAQGEGGERAGSGGCATLPAAPTGAPPLLLLLLLAAVVRRAARHDLPDEASVPARIVVGDEAFERIADVLSSPPEPTSALRELMRGQDD